ncbi:hypothetical protein DF19_09240 [Streptomyces olindensis]|nr:hypothetical protein DF19_09240 [Streptomyces olindensis]
MVSAGSMISAASMSRSRIRSRAVASSGRTRGSRGEPGRRSSRVTARADASPRGDQAEGHVLGFRIGQCAYVGGDEEQLEREHAEDEQGVTASLTSATNERCGMPPRSRGCAVFPQVGRGRTDVAHTFEDGGMVGVR